mmetsp:Transcript_83563/g.147769  ORF Transcript_83563/g.147769 Transcript_83563/m.147769 type:complete len:271 (+) Transcript_83563:54-866(+)|eukprot:CAMPEP_0197621050 /NCGR_PEP_ID=MMETSP1338-20131121/1693_1 /TAXON_ID=43686 ORGANISM="Pelagodinium beii, Strain RCC1491" /NCGR_SAMPLE_ID=MMETSP1338 /ASSEMBLY_ACC=CAM_ASM_000754 /LENGTH=270 /DNA_ID=CAMNT_0043190377 /DNA_START=54 /DNA_END=866 /DNA_ORIENTATION=-
MWGKSKGKGKEKGWGKDKGKDKGKAQTSADMTHLSTIDASQKVWIGSLTGVTWKELQEHFNQVGRTIYAAVFEKSQTGCVAYKSAAEVEQAVQSLNGSWLGGGAIEVDWFTKPDGRSGGKGKTSWAPKGKGKGGKTSWAPAPVTQPVWKPMFQKVVVPSVFSKGKGFKGLAKGEGKGKGKDKGQISEMAKLKSIDNSLKVWVGGLDGSVTWKMLEEHFTQVAKPTWATVFPKGTGCVAFATAEEAESAIVGLNGSMIGDCTLVVDVFQKQ